MTRKPMIRILARAERAHNAAQAAAMAGRPEGEIDRLLRRRNSLWAAWNRLIGRDPGTWCSDSRRVVIAL